MNGRREGKWVVESWWYFLSGESSGSSKETGLFENGVREGKWVGVSRSNDGRDVVTSSAAYEKPFVKGKLHGMRVLKRSEIYYYDLFLNGNYQYWFGGLHDTFRTSQSGRSEGYGVKQKFATELQFRIQNGKSHVVYRTPNGSVCGGPLVDGKRVGTWVCRRPGGTVSVEGAFVYG